MHISRLDKGIGTLLWSRRATWKRAVWIKAEGPCIMHLRGQNCHAFSGMANAEGKSGLYRTILRGSAWITRFHSRWAQPPEHLSATGG